MARRQRQMCIRDSNGTAFGGGLEVALCCHYRVIAPSAPVGLPEVKIGLLPGEVGTQRMPSIIGAAKEMDFMITGDPIPGPEAKELGIVDAVVEGDIVDGAINFANEVIANGSKVRRIRDETSVIEQDRGNEEIFEAARKTAASRMKLRCAPEMINPCVEAAVNECYFYAGMKVFPSPSTRNIDGETVFFSLLPCCSVHVPVSYTHLTLPTSDLV